jgi:hypothetical protein
MRDKGNMRTRGPHGLDSIVVVYCRGKELVYVARVRNGFVPASRRQLSLANCYLAHDSSGFHLNVTMLHCNENRLTEFLRTTGL